MRNGSECPHVSAHSKLRDQERAVTETLIERRFEAFSPARVVEVRIHLATFSLFSSVCGARSKPIATASTAHRRELLVRLCADSDCGSTSTKSQINPISRYRPG
jgi:hypothetical protein